MITRSHLTAILSRRRIADPFIHLKAGHKGDNSIEHVSTATDHQSVIVSDAVTPDSDGEAGVTTFPNVPGNRDL